MGRSLIFSLVIAMVVFGCGLAGLMYRAWHPEHEHIRDTRELIIRLTGLVATVTALGLLIASSFSFYNIQKTDLQTISVKILQLDGVLRRYGPGAQPVRDQLKALVTNSYNSLWNSSDANQSVPSIEQAVGRMDSLFYALDASGNRRPLQANIYW